MIFNNHSNLEGQHAFLGASKYHWINYDETKVADAYSKFLATQRGTVLHDFACQCITLGQKLPKSQKTLNMYVNDAISFRMVPEQILFYSENCFGTADTIVFRNGTLRIHDLKTGVVPAHMEQLEIYAALFCLEYKVKPSEIEMELRLYQNNEILYHTPTAEDISKSEANEKLLRISTTILKRKCSLVWLMIALSISVWPTSRGATLHRTSMRICMNTCTSLMKN